MQFKYQDFIDIYSALDDDERARYYKAYREEAEKMSTFAERFRQEGVEQGLQQGMRQGEAQLLLRLMTRKFGAVPEPVRRRIEAASPEQLLGWSERGLTAASAEEVFN